MPTRQEIILFLQELRETLIAHFENLDTPHVFERKKWDHVTGGGGEMGVIRGSVFEKAAVNFSAVSGDHFPFQDKKGPFFATGLSLITHMSNPHAPTVHMNLRYIETKEKSWFAGGYDLTPMGFFYDEDREHFHLVAKQTLDPFGSHLYPNFSEQASRYFYLPHRKKERGVGGIFFDSQEDFLMWKSIGTTFIDAILPIYHRRMHQSFSPEDKKKQLQLRAHYAEFNLLYDKGTQFGLLSGGNPEAIFCSMPPLASW